MPAQDVEVVQRIYDAFADHRFPEELLDKDFEWTTHPGLPDAGSHRGRETPGNPGSPKIAASHARRIA